MWGFEQQRSLFYRDNRDICGQSFISPVPICTPFISLSYYLSRTSRATWESVVGRDTMKYRVNMMEPQGSGRCSLSS